jgi:lysophospholipase L1-like esterase
MRRLLASVAAVGAAASMLLLPAPAEAASGPHAVPSWSMVPQSKDANGDGFIDGDGGVPRRGPLSLHPSSILVGGGNRIAQPHERLVAGSLSWYLSGRGYPVRLDACRSRGDTFRWTVTQAGAVVLQEGTRPLTRTTCARTVFLPEGPYDLTLRVRTGGRVDRAHVSATVHNILVVALGDSYASGEGNPRNVGAWLRRGGAFDPYWDDAACHRSTRAAPAQAALALEKASPTTSVTLVLLACSGATVSSGILGPQADAQQAQSQLEQAGILLSGRKADLVLLSIGGNDVGFSSILQTCALNSDCPLARAASGPLAAYRSVQEGVQAETAALAADLTSIAACIGPATCRLPDGRTVPALQLESDGQVLPTLYPDITRAANGQPCSYLTIPPQDFAWARDTVLSPAPPATYPFPLSRGGAAALSVASGSLNQQIAATNRLPGWHPVTGTWSASGDSPTGHGVCADASAWVFPLTGFGGFPSASFHPNPEGQSVMATAIQAAATRAS